MSFGTPFALLALLVVPAVLALAIVVDRRRSRHPIAFTNIDVLASVVGKRRGWPWRRWLPLALLLLSLATAAAAVARPNAVLTVADEKATVVILVDVSGSMRAGDVRPSRLGAAVKAMRIFLDRLPQRFQVGLVEFSDSPSVLVRPSHDRSLVRQQLGYMQPESGTAIGDGLQTSIRLITTSMAQQHIRRAPGKLLPAEIVLLSDGAQNRGVVQPLQAAGLARRDGIRIDTIALGTPGGSIQFGYGEFLNRIAVPPDPEVMRQIARASGGQTFTAQSAHQVSSIYRHLGSSIGQKRERRQITSWFAGVASLFLIAALALGRATTEVLP